MSFYNSMSDDSNNKKHNSCDDLPSSINRLSLNSNPLEPTILQIKNIPRNITLREAFLIFSLCFDDVTFVDIIQEPSTPNSTALNPTIIAKFSSSNIVLQVFQLLNGKHLFGAAFPPVHVAIFKDFNNISKNSSDENNILDKSMDLVLQQQQIDYNNNVNGNLTKIQLQEQNSRFLFGDPFMGNSQQVPSPTSPSPPQNKKFKDINDNPQVSPQNQNIKPLKKEFNNSNHINRINTSLSSSNNQNIADQFSPNDLSGRNTSSATTPLTTPNNIASKIIIPESLNANNNSSTPNTFSSGLPTPAGNEWTTQQNSFFNPNQIVLNGRLSQPLDESQQPQSQQQPSSSSQPAQQPTQSQSQPSQSQSKSQRQQINSSPPNLEQQQLLPINDQQSRLSSQPQPQIPELSLLARVPPPANPADQNPPCNTLYVGNLPPDATEMELRALFQPQTGFRRLSFRTKQNNGNSSHHGPMCFVEFEDVAHATRALAELYGRTLVRSTGNVTNNKGGIRLSFSKNPLGVRGPGQQRRNTNNVNVGVNPNINPNVNPNINPNINPNVNPNVPSSSSSSVVPINNSIHNNNNNSNSGSINGNYHNVGVGLPNGNINLQTVSNKQNNILMGISNSNMIPQNNTVGGYGYLNQYQYQNM